HLRHDGPLLLGACDAEVLSVRNGGTTAGLDKGTAQAVPFFCSARVQPSCRTDPHDCFGNLDRRLHGQRMEFGRYETCAHIGEAGFRRRSGQRGIPRVAWLGATTDWRIPPGRADIRTADADAAGCLGLVE